eukprot:TRINITY_DN2440_c0_g1_i2.p1 TRINITY_DN2440_c0_g1~~TRINITY_DN2440_c0_g1_i2.p1  ORF type:complete len:133 (+),score=31.01 TRINITY_DN2440_c0_g1_i2:274-672(+)
MFEEKTGVSWVNRHTDTTTLPNKYSIPKNLRNEFGSKENKEEQRKKKKATTKKTESGAPKKPKTAYLIFYQHMIEIAKKKNPSKTSVIEVSKNMSKLWAQLPPEEKEVFKKKAIEDKERYLKEIKNYEEEHK